MIFFPETRYTSVRNYAVAWLFQNQPKKLLSKCSSSTIVYPLGKRPPRRSSVQYTLLLHCVINICWEVGHMQILHIIPDAERFVPKIRHKKVRRLKLFVLLYFI